MPADTALSDTIVFELLDRARAERLCEQLRLRWYVGMYTCDDVVLVAVNLRPRRNDLATLLRAVEVWIADAEVGALRFHVDDRPYVLDAAGATQGENPPLLLPLEADLRLVD